MGIRTVFGKLLGRRPAPAPATLLGRLRRDVRGNTLAIMAAALIPLCGMVGGGLDMARLYMTKTRLQHACDAGALAGRKQMGAGTWGTDDNAAALQFFNANFTSTGMYGAGAPTVSFSESAGKVVGTASATLPMTLMKVLAIPDQTLAVTCDAEMRLPNTDIMFVLDTTGSMASKAVASDSQTKIEGLRTAVKCFYEIVARLDTDATCTTGTPSGGTGNQVQIRFGFMPYSMNVNVGKLLPTSYFADSWKYQSREPMWTTSTSTTWTQTNQTTSSRSASQSAPQSYCTQANADAMYKTHNEQINGNTKTVTDTTVQNLSWSNNVCSGTLVTVTTTYTSTTSTQTTFNQWHYGQLPVPVSALKNGSNWRSSFVLPLGASGASRTITWNGCIEERPTVRQSSFSTIPSGAYDLDIDMVPSSTNPNSLWGPALPQLIYGRDITTNYNQAQNTTDTYTTTDFWNSPNSVCPTEAKKLQTWPDPNAFDTYVDGLVANGNTYHDIGMLWGARFISPTGLFASENAYTPQGGEIERHIIFMTDGDAVSAPCDYTAYGIGFWDQRTTTDVGNAASCGNERGAMSDQVDARLDGLCTAVKNKNITLWVISFGNGSNSATERRLAACATTDRYFAARDSATLQQTFQNIANQISQLRLTK